MVKSDGVLVKAGAASRARASVDLRLPRSSVRIGAAPSALAVKDKELRPDVLPRVKAAMPILRRADSPLLLACNARAAVVE